MSNAINIFKYTDYKKYLTEWRLEEKNRSAGLTHEYLCRALGQNNRSYFSDIEKGRKIIGSEVLDRLIKLINLKEDEAKYFRALVGYGQSASYNEEEFWFERIIALNRAPRRELTTETFSYFRTWYHSVIRAYLDSVNFDGDYKKLSKELYGRVTPEEARKSVALLQKLDMVKENGEGFLKPTDKVITVGDSVRHDCIKAYNVANNEILHSILEDNSEGTHNSSLLTISISREGMSKIEKRIHNLRQEIMTIAHEDTKDADGVYQVAVHAFPLVRVGGAE